MSSVQVTPRYASRPVQRMQAKFHLHLDSDSQEISMQLRFPWISLHPEIPRDSPEILLRFPRGLPSIWIQRYLGSQAIKLPRDSSISIFPTQPKHNQCQRPTFSLLCPARR